MLLRMFVFIVTELMAANAGNALGVGTANTSSNVLDDYEEGTWTPAASVSSSDVSGSYVKVGNIVIAKFKISIMLHLALTLI